MRNLWNRQAICLIKFFTRDVFDWFACGNWKSCFRQPSMISTNPYHWTLCVAGSNKRCDREKGIKNFLLIALEDRSYRHFRLRTNYFTLFPFSSTFNNGRERPQEWVWPRTRISWIRPCACILLCNVAMLKLVNFFSQKKSWESVNQQYYKFSATAQHKNCASSTFDDGPGRDLFRVLKRSPIPRPHALVLRWTCSDGKVQEATRRDSDEDCIHTGCGKKVSMVFVGKYLQAKVAQKLVGQVCGNSDKNPSHPQKFSCSYTSAWRCASCPDQKTIYVKL